MIKMLSTRQFSILMAKSKSKSALVQATYKAATQGSLKHLTKLEKPMSLETQPSLFDIHLIFIQIPYSCNVQLGITQTNTVYFTEIPEDLYVAITVSIGFTAILLRIQR